MAMVNKVYPRTECRTLLSGAFRLAYRSVLADCIQLFALHKDFLTLFCYNNLDTLRKRFICLCYS